MSAEIRWHVYSSPDTLADALAAAVALRARQRIASRGEYSIVLTGGSTPRALYTRLAGIDSDWARWRIYFGDERCVPRGDAERNDALAHALWLGRVPIPEDRIHAIPAELGPERGADAYARLLADAGRFDTTLLGIGEDGHVASLFPGRPDGLDDDAPDAIGVRGSPKPPPERVSLSARRLRESDEIVLLVTGAAKRDAIARLARLDPSIPATAVATGGADVWLDEDAAAALRPARAPDRL